MNPSTEVETVVREFLIARAAVDVETMKSLVSRSNHVRVIGSGEDDWNQGYKQAVQLWSGQGSEIRPVADRTLRHVEAFENGDTGWAAIEQEIAFAEGQTFVVRITFVVVQEDSAWKISQIHFSVPIPE
ncbi:MAG: nuclear transport factor 2 family protein [Acidimicrobiia bacterium]